MSGVSFHTGDTVLSRSEHQPHGPVEAKRVEEVFTRLGQLLEIHVHGQTLKTTEEHPFWVVGEGWLPARELRSGMQLLSHHNQPITIQSVRPTGDWSTVYNLRVADYHTDFVGTPDWGFSIWAHNTYSVEHYGGGWYRIKM